MAIIDKKLNRQYGINEDAAMITQNELAETKQVNQEKIHQLSQIFGIYTKPDKHENTKKLSKLNNDFNFQKKVFSDGRDLDTFGAVTTGNELQ